MCILLKFDMQSLVFLTCFFSNIIEEKPLGGGQLDPPLVKEGLKV